MFDSANDLAWTGGITEYPGPAGSSPAGCDGGAHREVPDIGAAVSSGECPTAQPTRSRTLEAVRHLDRRPITDSPSGVVERFWYSVASVSLSSHRKSARVMAGSLTPTGAPSTLPRAAITDPNAVAAANAAAAMTHGRPSVSSDDRLRPS
jgi:hypothetical protein